MRIISRPDELKPGRRKVCLAIGFFDGVHLGHQQILRQTITDAAQHEALALVITFDRHPNTIVAPHRVPQLIYPLEKKLRTIESFGPHAALVLKFDEALSRRSGEQFTRDLHANLGRLQSICVGANFVFGHKRSGNVELLRRLATELGFTVHGVAAVALDGKPVSSTRIRDAIRLSDLDAAGQMLGRAYALCGKVVPGERLGHKLGFPTANLDTTGLVLPPNGVYAAHAQLERRTFKAVVNIGFRPTIQPPESRPRVEAHVLEFNGDLYGREIELELMEKLRDEKRFASLDELRAQIGRDITEARQRL